jgi:hypothetical protein
MARYILIQTIAGSPNPSGAGYGKWGRGRTIADTTANAIDGDIVWPALCTAPSPINMAPLDSAASAIMGLPIVTAAALAAWGGIGGAGTDAGD